PQFAKFFDEWLLTHPAKNPSAPLSPFHMHSYSRALDAGEAHLSKVADAQYQAGSRADEIGNKYVQGTVVLALSLFLGGVTQGFARKKLRDSVLVVAAVFCLLGLIRIATLPALRLSL